MSKIEGWRRRIRDLESYHGISIIEEEHGIKIDYSNLTPEEVDTLNEATKIMERHGNLNFKEYSSDEMSALHPAWCLIERDTLRHFQTSSHMSRTII